MGCWCSSSEPTEEGNDYTKVTEKPPLAEMSPLIETSPLSERSSYINHFVLELILSQLEVVQHPDREPFLDGYEIFRLLKTSRPLYKHIKYIPSLILINLGKRNCVTDLGPLTKNCNSLKVLDLTWCKNLQSVLPLMQCTSLHTLILRGCDMKDVSGLGQCPSLHTLDLTSCIKLINVSGLGQCPSLHTLNLSGCWRVTDVSGLGQCASLHTLDLSWCRGVTDVSDLGQCASLHTLDISWCYRINVVYLEMCQSLKMLRLQGCHALNDVLLNKHCTVL